MNKYSQRFNIAFSLYYGIAGLVFTSLGLYGLFKWLYQVYVNEADFSWWILIGICSACAFSATITFIIIRLGIEQFKK